MIRILSFRIADLNEAAGAADAMLGLAQKFCPPQLNRGSVDIVMRADPRQLTGTIGPPNPDIALDVFS